MRRVVACFSFSLPFYYPYELEKAGLKSRDSVDIGYTGVGANKNKGLQNTAQLCCCCRRQQAPSSVSLCSRAVFNLQSFSCLFVFSEITTTERKKSIVIPLVGSYLDLLGSLLQLTSRPNKRTSVKNLANYSSC